MSHFNRQFGFWKTIWVIPWFLCGCSTFFSADDVSRPSTDPNNVNNENNQNNNPNNQNNGSDIGMDTSGNNQVADMGNPDSERDLDVERNCTGDCVCENESCVCRADCNVSCSGECSAECFGSECTFDGDQASNFSCGANGTCETTCGETCELECEDKTAECHTACPDGSSCIIFCGTERNTGPPGLRLPCDFSSCAGEPVDCGGGTFVCGRACP